MCPSLNSSDKPDECNTEAETGPKAPSQSLARKGSRPFALYAFLSLLFCGLLAFVFAGAFPDKRESFLPVTVPIPVSEKESTVMPTESEPLPLAGKIIILDAGHGGYDSGCVYPEKDPVYLEKDYNLKIALQAKSVLEKLGAEVYMTRSDDTFISMYSRAAQAHLLCLNFAEDQGISSISEDLEESMRDELSETIRINSVDLSGGCMGPMVGSGFSEEMIELLEFEYAIDDILFLSIHNNWNSQTDMHGTLVYYVTDDSIIESEDRLIKEDPYYQNPDYTVREHYFGRSWQRNADLAQIMHDSITAAAPELVSSDLRQTVSDNFAVLREHGLASVLLELTFVSNENDRMLLDSDSVIQKMAEGIADGCVNYFDSLEKKTS
jgi:N-acetylmuramoyl-L-alanine amidase